MMKKYLLLITLAGIVVFSSCSKDDNGPDNSNPDDCSAVDITYDGGIKAIIDSNCAISTCHGGDPSIPNFTNYDNVFARRSAIQSRVVAKSMPPAGRTALAQDNINKIRCWVENGAPK
jgi:hypothetical protein